VAIVRDKVNEWDSRLRELSELMGQWLTCQRSWLQLEPVFAPPDVQRQLPMEHKMYVEVDRFWKDTMRRVAAQPNALNALKMPALLRQFIKYVLLPPLISIANWYMPLSL
jgi:dynein heavy chain